MTIHSTPRNASLASVVTEPVSLQEAKTHLRIPQADAFLNEDIEALIIGARQTFERDTQHVTSLRAATEVIDFFPYVHWRFYHHPIVSVTSINYFDSGNVSQLLSSSVYSLDVPNRRLLLAVGEDWPSVETRWDAVTIVYSAGQAVVDEAIKSAIKLRVKMEFDGDDEKGTMARAYDRLAERYMRSSYP